MSQELPTTSYALLGLLTFGDDLTGYELKQRADRTLRYYWVSPAMSQVYTELARLADLGLVRARDAGPAGPARSGRSARYSITPHGREQLGAWLASAAPEFPTLKHPVALRLLMGHLSDPGTVTAMLRDYLAQLVEVRAELQGVRDSLRNRDGVGDAFRHPALVADWGLEYFDSERAITEKLLRRLEDEG
ncbi:MAG: PadR family transcriptional regulator [Nocardioidaceae bacterium]